MGGEYGEIRASIDIDNLNAYLSKHIPGIKTPVDVKQFNVSKDYVPEVNIAYFFLSEVWSGMLSLFFHGLRSHKEDLVKPHIFLDRYRVSINYSIKKYLDVVPARLDLSCVRSPLVSFFRRLPIKSKENTLCWSPCKNTI